VMRCLDTFMFTQLLASLKSSRCKSVTPKKKGRPTATATEAKGRRNGQPGTFPDRAKRLARSPSSGLGVVVLCHRPFGYAAPVAACAHTGHRKMWRSQAVRQWARHKPKRFMALCCGPPRNKSSKVGVLCGI
jgi:hypothetical protein